MTAERDLDQNMKSQRRRGILNRKRGKAAVPVETGLFLRSIGRSVEVWQALDDPAIALLASEDACWCSSMAVMQAHRPSRYHRAEWREWAAEREALADKRKRIQAMAAELGLVPINA